MEICKQWGNQSLGINGCSNLDVLVRTSTSIVFFPMIPFNNGHILLPPPDESFHYEAGEGKTERKTFVIHSRGNEGTMERERGVVSCQ